jgi:chromosome segregation ATPase
MTNDEWRIYVDTLHQQLAAERAENERLRKRLDRYDDIATSGSTEALVREYEQMMARAETAETRYVNEITPLQITLDARERELVTLRNTYCDTLQRAEGVEKERDSLREQVKVLHEILSWFVGYTNAGLSTTQENYAEFEAQLKKAEAALASTGEDNP